MSKADSNTRQQREFDLQMHVANTRMQNKKKTKFCGDANHRFEWLDLLLVELYEFVLYF